MSADEIHIVTGARARDITLRYDVVKDGESRCGAQMSEYCAPLRVDAC